MPMARYLEVDKSSLLPIGLLSASIQSVLSQLQRTRTANDEQKRILKKAIELTVKWYLENPLAPDSFEEKNLGDPYDYAREDKLIRIWSTAAEQLKQQLQQVPESEKTETGWRHPYAHPKKPGDLK